jgi:ABC-type transporter MlaC component
MKIVITLMVVSLASFLALPVFADSAQSTVEKIIATFSSSASNENLSAAISRRIDFADMAESASGQYWLRLTSSQKTQLVQLIAQLVRDNYYPRWHKLFKKGKVTYQGESASAGDTVVKTTLTIGKKTSLVNWRLHPHDGEMQVLSLSVGEKDLLSKMHKRFQAKLQASGFTGLTAWLKRKMDNGSADDQMATELR